MSSLPLPPLSLFRAANGPCTDTLRRLPEGTSWVYKSARVKSEMTLAEGWSRTHPSPFKGGWGGGGGVITERIYLTHITEGSLPLSVRATWQHCKTSQRFWEPQCGCMCLRALWQSQARFIAQHTNGLPGFILQLREGLSLEMISCLEQLTRQTTTRLASPYFLHTAAKWWKKSRLSHVVFFFCAGGE